VCVAHDQRRHDHAAADRLLQEQRAEVLGGPAVRVSNSITGGLLVNTVQDSHTIDLGGIPGATIAPNGKKIVFTSLRDGDLDIYTMDLDGRNVKRLTNEIGYDGGPFFSYDSQWIIYRAYHPTSEKDIADYTGLLKQGLIRPTTLEIWIMKADGTGKRQITHNGKANFAPYFFPDGKRVIFASNMDDPKGRNFDLYSINTDGTGVNTDGEANFKGQIFSNPSAGTLGGLQRRMFDGPWTFNTDLRLKKAENIPDEEEQAA